MSRLSWLVVLLALWVAWVGVAYLVQRRLIFPRHLVAPVGGVAGRETPAGVEKVRLAIPGGGVDAWYVPPGEASTASGDAVDGDAPGSRRVPGVIFAHGNAELARDWVGAYRSLARRGVAVLLVEYPGYGASDGSPSEASIGAAMTSAWDHLAGRSEVDPERIVGLGRSLGGGAVGALAAERPLAALVLQSTFTSLRPFARRMLVPGALVRDPFDNLTVLRRFEGPVLLFHGSEDSVVPYAHGERLADAAANGRLVTWACGHNDCPPDWEGYLDTIVAFLGE